MRFVLRFGNFAVLRENWPVSPFGEISEFCTGYRCDSDGYHLDITFVRFVSTFMVFGIFGKTGQFRRFRCFPSFRVLFSFGVLTRDFHDFHDDLFDG